MASINKPPWNAVWFATFLCLIMLAGSILFRSSVDNPGFPAFFSFLPVVFWMVARKQKEDDKTINELKARIEALEATMRSAGGVAG